MNSSVVVDRLIGASSGLDIVRFKEGNHWFECVMPLDALWTALKDNILLREYERGGIFLKDVTGTVVDAGAHVGLFSLRASAHADIVISLEPDVANFHLLQLNLDRNLRTNSSSEHHARQAALWSRPGQVRFAAGDHSAGGQVSQAQAGPQVPALTLSEIVDTWGHIGLLKLDIEGAEFIVLRSASKKVLRCIDMIVGELHLEADPRGDREVEQRLSEAGFYVQILESPVHYWKDNMGHLLRNHRYLQGHWRLKLTAAGIYALFPIANRVFDLEERNLLGSLRYLYAVRRADAPSGRATSESARHDNRLDGFQ